MKKRVKAYKVGRARAVAMAANLNGVSKETAGRYTDSELKEVLRLLSGHGYRLVADFGECKRNDY